MGYRLGADIGGTFTDLVLVDDAGTTFRIGKILTTPDRPDDAVLAGLEELLAAARLSPRDVGHVIHGTTLFTNALIERKGARTALVTTKCFRDAVEIGREHRYDMYDPYMQRPKPLAPRHLRFEMDERVLADGGVRKPLDEAELSALAGVLAAERVEASRSASSTPTPTTPTSAASARSCAPGFRAWQSRSPASWCRRSVSTTAARRRSPGGTGVDCRDRGGRRPPRRSRRYPRRRSAALTEPPP